MASIEFRFEYKGDIVFTFSLKNFIITKAWYLSKKLYINEVTNCAKIKGYTEKEAKYLHCCFSTDQIILNHRLKEYNLSPIIPKSVLDLFKQLTNLNLDEYRDKFKRFHIEKIFGEMFQYNYDLYLKIFNQEEKLRNNLEKYKDNYDQLVEFNRFDPDLYLQRSLSPNIFMKEIMPPLMRYNKDSQEKIDFISKLLNSMKYDYQNDEFLPGGQVLAGGAVLSTLFKIKSSDYDIFIYGCNEKEAELKILSLTNYIDKKYTLKNVIRGTNSVTINFSEEEIKIIKEIVPSFGRPKIIENRYSKTRHYKIQIILRLYSKAHEIIHGFDVDCCSILFEDDKFWMTKRCQYSLQTWTNTVNFNRFSPSYEQRLVKYATRGFAIYIPEFKESSYYSLYQNYKKIKLLNVKFDPNNFNGLKYLFYSGLFYLRLLKTGIVDYQLRYRYRNVRNIFKSRNFNDTEKELFYEKKEEEDKISDYSKNFKDNRSNYVKSKNINFLTYPFTENRILKISGTPLRDTWYFIGIKNVDYDKFTMKKLENLFHLNTQNMKDLIKELKETSKKDNAKIDFPSDLTWKTINPGEQFTGTFHKLVIEDESQWYK